MSENMKTFLKWLAVFLWAAVWLGVAAFVFIFTLPFGTTTSALLFPPVIIPAIIGIIPALYLLFKRALTFYR